MYSKYNLVKMISYLHASLICIKKLHENFDYEIKISEF